ncbi:MAG TPA: Crp/Fnr family transcriptional regulator [Candidatus Xenobia bacterium]|nr:Crp/Fnr family transcriptional regulator [Candidatus Xenobia bacterium]
MRASLPSFRLIAFATLLLAPAPPLAAEEATASGAAGNLEYAFWAFLLGLLAAASLLLGSGLAIFWKPRAGLTASLTAFGAGALLAALSVEIVAPHAMAVLGHGAGGPEGEPHGADPLTALVAMLVGSVAGGIVFVLLDQLIGAHGGYLRKTATTISYLGKRRQQRMRHMLQRLGQIEFLRSLPPEHVQELVRYVRPVAFQKDERLFSEGDRGDRLYFLAQGEIELLKGGAHFKRLGAGEVLGEIALLTGAPRTASAVARTHVLAIELLKEDFDRLRKTSPELEAATARLASARLDELRERHEEAGRATADWARQAADALRYGTALPTPQEVKQAASEHKSAALAIWLGTLLDGLSESFVIGTSLLALISARLATGAPSLTEVVPYTFLAGLFLSNFPEALSSSVGMKDQGWDGHKILLLWGSLVVITAAGSAVGYLVGSEVNYLVVVGVEGLAAGAMLTMVAQAMIPEAVHLGGASVVGLSTLAGFLSAVAFKILER